MQHDGLIQWSLVINLIFSSSPVPGGLRGGAESPNPIKPAFAFL